MAAIESRTPARGQVSDRIDVVLFLGVHITPSVYGGMTLGGRRRFPLRSLMAGRLEGLA